MTFQYIKAEEFCESVRDGTHDTPKKTKTGYKLITGKNIKQGQINLEDTYYISEKDYLSINKRSLVEKWDVLMSMIGTVGESAIVKAIPNYAIKNIALFKCGNSELKGKWLNYYLHTPMAQNQMLCIMRGCSQQFLSLEQIRNLYIPICNENYMQKIIDILSAYDDLIEINQKQIRLLEEAARRLYKEWFVDLRFPGHEDTPITDGIPKGWSTFSLSQIFNYTRGKSYSSEELSSTKGIYLINLKNINAWGGYKRDAEKRFTGTYSKSHEVKSGDIIMAVTDMTQERRLVGHVALVPVFSKKAIISMDLIKIIPKESVTHYFLYSMLRFSSIAEQISQYANGANVLHLRPENIAQIKVRIPSKDLMMQFEKIVANYYEKIEPLEKQILLLQEARDRLLPKLMSGEIEV